MKELSLPKSLIRHAQRRIAWWLAAVFAVALLGPLGYQAVHAQETSFPLSGYSNSLEVQGSTSLSASGSVQAQFLGGVRLAWRGLRVAWPYLKGALIIGGGAWGLTHLDQVGESVVNGLNHILGLLNGLLVTLTSATLVLFETAREVGDQLMIDKASVLAQAIRSAWGFVLGIANLFFLLALIISAMALIMKTTGYNLKKVIGNILFYLILANISYIIAVLIFSLGISLSTGIGNSPSFASGMESFSTTYNEVFLGLSKEEGKPSAFELIRESMPEEQRKRGSLALLGILLLAFVLNVIFFFTLLRLLLVVIERIVRLAILIILAPLAYALALLPAMEKWIGEWWKQFMAWILALPFALLILGIAAAVLQGLDKILTVEGSESKFILVKIFQFAYEEQPDPAALGGILMTSIVVLSLIWLAGEVPKMLGAGATIMEGLMSKVGKGALVAGGVAGLFAGAQMAGMGERIRKRGEELEKKATERGEKVPFAAKWRQVAGGALQRIPAVPGAAKELFTGIKEEQKRKMEEGKKAVFGSIIKWAPETIFAKAVSWQAREGAEKIASSIGQEVQSYESTTELLKKASKGGPDLHAFMKGLSLRRTRGKKEEVEAIERAYRDFIAANPDFETKAVKPIANLMNFGIDYPIARMVRAGQEWAPSLLGNLGKLRFDLGQMEVPADLLEKTEEFNILVKRAANEQRLINVLKQGGLGEQEARDLIEKNPQALELIQRAASPGGERWQTVLQDAQFFGFLQSLTSDQRKTVSGMVDTGAIQSYLAEERKNVLPRSTPLTRLSEVQLMEYSAKIQSLGRAADIKGLGETQRVVSSTAFPQIATEVNNAVTNYNQANMDFQALVQTPGGQALNQTFENWQQQAQPDLQKLEGATGGLVELRSGYEKEFQTLQELRQTTANQLDPTTLNTMIQHVEKQLSQNIFALDRPIDAPTLKGIADQLGLSVALLQKYNRNTAQLLGNFYHYREIKKKS